MLGLCETRNMCCMPWDVACRHMGMFKVLNPYRNTAGGLRREKGAQTWSFLFYTDYWELSLAYAVPAVPRRCPGGKLVETGQCDAGKQAANGGLGIERALMIQLAPWPFVLCSVIDVLRETSFLL